MICKKCNYILSGSESFCPDCGTPCVKEKDFSQEKEKTTTIFSSEKELPSSIFTDEPAVLHHAEKKKSKAGVYLAAVLILVIVGTVAITLTDVLDLTPVISSFIGSVNEKITEEKPSPSEYSPLSGVISPAVSYKTETAYITGEKGQTLRKGPDDFYGQIDTLPVGTAVHILGTTGTESNWIYVYVPESDFYGWISSSFVSTFTSSEKKKKQTEKIPETTDEETTTEILSEE